MHLESVRMGINDSLFIKNIFCQTKYFITYHLNDAVDESLQEKGQLWVIRNQGGVSGSK